MSNGPGIQQQRILTALKEKKEWTLESLRWREFEQHGGRGLDGRGKLPGSWNTSFGRAVEGLEEKGRISIDSRPLENFEECADHFPGKTLDGNARALRLQMLPALLEWTRDPRGLGPKYGAADNEEFHLAQLTKENPPELTRLAGEWYDLEDHLRHQYGNAVRPAADTLLKLICRGRNLFYRRDVSASGSLGGLIGTACGNGGVSDELAERLKTFLEEFIPSGRSAALEFKSIMHQLADSPRHGHTKLREPTLDYLHEKEKVLVEAMEGFVPKVVRPWGKFVLPDESKNKYPPDLIKLFDQSVFQEFRFLKLN